MADDQELKDQENRKLETIEIVKGIENDMKVNFKAHYIKPNDVNAVFNGVLRESNVAKLLQLTQRISLKKV